MTLKSTAMKKVIMTYLLRWMSEEQTYSNEEVEMNWEQELLASRFLTPNYFFACVVWLCIAENLPKLPPVPHR
jgi:hypothetical protein